MMMASDRLNIGNKSSVVHKMWPFCFWPYSLIRRYFGGIVRIGRRRRGSRFIKPLKKLCIMAKVMIRRTKEMFVRQGVVEVRP